MQLLDLIFFKGIKYYTGSQRVLRTVTPLWGRCSRSSYIFSTCSFITIMYQVETHLNLSNPETQAYV